MSSSYHPQSDGQSEVTNRCLEHSIGMTPFLALYGRNPPMIPRYELGHSLVHEVDLNLATRDEILHDLKIHLSKAANQMKQAADIKRRDVQFSSVSKRAFQKLASRFYGPFRVEEKIGNLAYKLQLPPDSRVHPVFHVSLLKQHVGESVPVSTAFPQLNDDGYAVFEPKEESLVRWKHFSPEDATWESSADLKA
ncbi:hypothetical protein MANES_01G067266v8 [Manihot esculenta]|uniref:Uncharacterized protein n=1 Tax=Manihot esculenta TaxID=3983 RepID=A0ACB7ICI5_MANES|nr:hypothetical protein MANES_01G067266v8 [Manihot esculenta]